MSAEHTRLQEDKENKKHWKKWGPYLTDRQWGTVREDYSPDGAAWENVTHDHARSKAYRWGEEGIAGLSDHRQIICMAWAFWNGKDPFLKERFFGLTGNQGNHGEDVKEVYFYQDSTPTHSYMKMLYKYPQAEFPYQKLVDENKKASKLEDEYELLDLEFLTRIGILTLSLNMPKRMQKISWLRQPSPTGDLKRPNSGFCQRSGSGSFGLLATNPSCLR